MIGGIQGIHDWPVFVAAGLLLNLTPGADMALIASRGASQGFRAGAAAALGVGAGCGVHIAAAALGLSALLASSDLAFTALRWIGAAYLLWLGVGLLTSTSSAAASDPATARPQALQRVFAQGFLTNALNPKVALFFLAFVPQFIVADAPHKALAFMALGAVFVINGTVVNLGVAGLAAGMRRRLAGHAALGTLGRWLNRGVGALFVAFGLKLALGAVR